MANKRFFLDLPKRLDQAKLKINKRLVVFLIFVGIATFLWFLRALEQDYVTRISHPVSYTNLPTDKVLVHEMPSKLSIEVKGKGFAIIRHNWDISKNPVQLNFGQLHRQELPSTPSIKIQVFSSQIKPQVASQLTKLSVNSITPESLMFEFSEKITKRVPIHADIFLDLEKQFMIRNGIILLPDSVDISGPAAIVDTINSILTTEIKLKKVNKSIKRNLSLVSPGNELQLSVKKVVVEIPVEQYTEKSLSVPVVAINVPDSLHLKTFPAQVEVKFRVVISAFDLIQPQDFQIVVDYLETAQDSPVKIKPHILVAPGLIENPRIKPEWLDYLLEQK